jgi:hypothetical protein
MGQNREWTERDVRGPVAEVALFEDIVTEACSCSVEDGARNLHRNSEYEHRLRLSTVFD